MNKNPSINSSTNSTSEANKKSSANSSARVIHAPTGSQLTCKGWLQEAAYRMIQNNLDPAVAERPEDLVVYGGIGKAARNWESYDKILQALKTLENKYAYLSSLKKRAAPKNKLPL